MIHKGTLTVGPFIAKGLPYHIECSCGTAGDFNLENQARGYWQMHVSRGGPTETFILDVPGARKPAAKPTPKVEAKK